MSKRHYFISYHHSTDFESLQNLRKKSGSQIFKDYGFKYMDLGEESKVIISGKIQERIWTSSILIVLIGSQTGKSKWNDWEIWYSLRNIKGRGSERRKHKPKGILAIYLPFQNPDTPKRLENLLSSGYATKIELTDLNESPRNLEKILNQVYLNRENIHLIGLNPKPEFNPQSPSNRIFTLFLGVKHFFRSILMKMISQMTEN